MNINDLTKDERAAYTLLCEGKTWEQIVSSLTRIADARLALYKHSELFELERKILDKMENITNPLKA